MREQTLIRIQRRAIRTGIRIFLEEDLMRGIGRDRRRFCCRCHRQRRAAGFIDYGEVPLCNGCAQDYELARLHDRSLSVDDYVDRPPAGASGRAAAQAGGAARPVPHSGTCES